jgi:hypothetical protein
MRTFTRFDRVARDVAAYRGQKLRNIVIKPRRLFFVENTGQQELPINDNLTRKIESLWEKATEKPGAQYKGFHTCDCGKRSDNSDWNLPGGITTNSLCVHYVKYHRSKLSPEDIAYLTS